MYVRVLRENNSPTNEGLSFKLLSLFYLIFAVNALNPLTASFFVRGRL